MKKMLLLASLALCSCSESYDDDSNIFFDRSSNAQEYEDIVDNFMTDVEKYDINVYNYFKDYTLIVTDAPSIWFEDQTVAMCTIWGYKDIREITINKKYWDTWKDTPVLNKLAMYHELGHCLLDIEDHDTLQFSMMAEYIDPVGLVKQDLAKIYAEEWDFNFKRMIQHHIDTRFPNWIFKQWQK
jgi:hypothetical protein